MLTPRHAYLYQINARTWVEQLSREFGQTATLEDVPEADLEEIASLGFDWVYLLGVWQTGEAGRRIARQESQTILTHAAYTIHPAENQPPPAPDSPSEADICSSCFSITGYTVNAQLGGNKSLEHLRQRLSHHGLRLMLDFIPNHTAIDHPWVQSHPEFYLERSQEVYGRHPNCCIRLKTGRGERLLAHGRDPYFPAWTDTLQLNYNKPEVLLAMRAELQRAASFCDGLRCDMAMLILPEVFKRTWGNPALPFWQQAIETVRQSRPDFIFMAEVYWDLEWTLQQQGFDYTYDKPLYDRLIGLHAHPVREHLRAEAVFQDHLVRFLENHDEPRAAAVFPPDVHRAAAAITFLSPGMRFFQHGQLQGYQKRTPVQLCRVPDESVDEELRDFYLRLLECLRLPVVRSGDWQLIDPLPAWEGNWTWQGFVAYWWHGLAGEHLLVAVNYSPHQSQCYLRLPFDDLRGRSWRLRDLICARSEAGFIEGARLERAGDELVERGLYLDMPEWGIHVFAFEE